MMAAGLLCLLLAAGEAATSWQGQTPPALRELLDSRPTLIPQHEGYLKELARYPDLAESETAWWQSASRLASGGLAARLEELAGIGGDDNAPFEVYYEHLARDPDLRNAVENLLRTELEQSRDRPALARAVQQLRADPDLAMRFLENPVAVRPLPEAVQEAYTEFLNRPEWREALRSALGNVVERPSAHIGVLPWWQQLEQLADSTGTTPGETEAELYKHPRALWLWHLRNINLAREKEARPWIRYWNRLIHRDPDLARQYGPFITDLLHDPESLRQHLADLQERQAGAQEPWPPKFKPPKLPPLGTLSPVEDLKRGIKRPTIQKPDRPERPRMDTPARPGRPSRPQFPEFPAASKSMPDSAGRRPVFPTFPAMPDPNSADRGETEAE